MKKMIEQGILLRIENVTKIFRIGGRITGSKLVAVSNANIEMEGSKPEIFALAGESGSGKTTLARMILGLIEPSSGRIIFKGRDINTLKNKKDKLWFKREVQPIFQNPFEAFNPLKKVESYLFETAKNLLSLKTKDEVLENVSQAVKAVGMSLEEIKGRYPSEFSGGQLQRLSIARALIAKPSLLIADEPVSMVDASLRMSILNLFRNLNKDHGVSIIYITHDLATAYYVSDRIAIMFRGVIVELGPVDEVLSKPYHPYTQLLLESIPKPDPDRKWERRIKLSDMEVKEYSLVGCKFVTRCPYAKEICKKKEPPFVHVEKGRSVKCFLYSNGTIKISEEG